MNQPLNELLSTNALNESDGLALSREDSLAYITDDLDASQLKRVAKNVGRCH